MIKIITFGSREAELHISEHRAALYTGEKSLPVELADALTETGDIYVHSVQMNGNGFGVIGMTHDLYTGDLLAEVCDTISRVYDTDTTISNARP